MTSLVDIHYLVLVTLFTLFGNLFSREFVEEKSVLSLLQEDSGGFRVKLTIFGFEWV